MKNTLEKQPKAVPFRGQITLSGVIIKWSSSMRMSPRCVLSDLSETRAKSSAAARPLRSQAVTLADMQVALHALIEASRTSPTYSKLKNE